MCLILSPFTLISWPHHWQSSTSGLRGKPSLLWFINNLFILRIKTLECTWILDSWIMTFSHLIWDWQLWSCMMFHSNIFWKDTRLTILILGAQLCPYCTISMHWKREVLIGLRLNWFLVINYPSLRMPSVVEEVTLWCFFLKVTFDLATCFWI